MANTHKIGNRDAQGVFRDLLGICGSEVDKEAREEARALIVGSVGTALAAVQRYHEVGLTARGAADTLDEIVGATSDPEDARRLMRDHLTAERRAELLVARGDLPSSAATVAEPDDVFTAILADIGDDEFLKSSLIRAWMLKLRDRDDYAELLQRKIGDFTVEQHLLVSILLDVKVPYPDSLDMLADEDEGCDDECDDECGDECEDVVECDEHTHELLRALEHATDDTFYDLGLDPDRAREEIRNLIEARDIPEFDVEDVELARRELAVRRRKLETAPTMVEAVRRDAEAAASDLDF